MSQRPVLPPLSFSSPVSFNLSQLVRVHRLNNVLFIRNGWNNLLPLLSRMEQSAFHSFYNSASEKLHVTCRLFRTCMIRVKETIKVCSGIKSLITYWP